jgi:hypothetical protein
LNPSLPTNLPLDDDTATARNGQDYVVAF